MACYTQNNVTMISLNTMFSLFILCHLSCFRSETKRKLSDISSRKEINNITKHNKYILNKYNVLAFRPRLRQVLSKKTLQSYFTNLGVEY